MFSIQPPSPRVNVNGEAQAQDQGPPATKNVPFFLVLGNLKLFQNKIWCQLSIVLKLFKNKFGVNCQLC
jgi:hypothetical protein